MSLTNKIGDNDAGEVLDSITENMLEGYARGAGTAVIYTGNEYVHGALTRWYQGWIRKAGIGGIWKDSKGMRHGNTVSKKQYDRNHNDNYYQGRPIAHQPKIQIILALKRRIDLELHLVEQEIWREPLYMIRFHAGELFTEE